MKSYHKCLSCYKPIQDAYYHPKCAKALFGTKEAPLIELTSEQIEQLGKESINKSLSVTGVQKKLSLGISKSHSTKQSMTIVGYLGGTHILKPPTEEYPQMPEIENLTMHLADFCKIRTAPHGLIPLADGKLAYITRRFDRHRHRKIAVEDLCQLSNTLTEQKYNSTAERVGKIIRQHSSNPGDDALRYFEVTVFSFITGNNDMHLKNFSMMTDDPRYIHLSPSYDLLSTRLMISEKDDPEELALSVQGKKSSLKRSSFLSLGDNLKIPTHSVVRALNQFVVNAEGLVAAISNSILTEETKAQYTNLVLSRLNRLKP